MAATAVARRLLRFSTRHTQPIPPMSSPAFQTRFRSLTCAESRQLDRTAIDRYGISGLTLMENAGAAAAGWIDQHYREQLAVADSAGGNEPITVCILCGKGNNGGDGYVIARHLPTVPCYQAAFPTIAFPRPTASDSRGPVGPLWQVRILSVVPLDQLSGDAAVNCRIAQAAGIAIEVVNDADSLAGALPGAGLIVDCLLGTGSQGAPRGLFAAAIRLANALPVPRIAIDVPSGLDADSGRPADPCCRATATLTMVAPKVGFANPAAAAVLGQVVCLPIGLPWAMLRPLLA